MDLLQKEVSNRILSLSNEEINSLMLMLEDLANYDNMPEGYKNILQNVFDVEIYK